MKKKIKVGIYGYGNLGAAVEKLLKSKNFNNTFELVAVFSKRWESLCCSEKSAFYPYERLCEWKDKIDVMFLCSGSMAECEKDGLNLIKNFDFIDAFDNHAEIKKYYLLLNSLALKGKRTAFISCGWDPGVFSCMRTLFYALTGESNTVFGRGISQGHSNALKTIDGVSDAVSVTVPKPFTKRHNFGRDGRIYSSKDLHIRECYVASDTAADRKTIREKIISMPDYFDGYRLKIKFCSPEKVKKIRGTFMHGGKVKSVGNVGGKRCELGFSLKTESNPVLTAKIMLTYARALIRYKKSEKFGAFLPSQIAFRDVLGCDVDFIGLT